MDRGIQRHLAFVEAVERGSLTRAAERLFCSQSSVSRMIADLEREWDVTLLRRDRAGVQLTSDGASLLPASREIVDAYRRMREKVEGVRDLVAGCIRIGCISSVATHRLPSIIGTFRSEYPGIEYELLLGDYTDIERWLREGRVDCGFLRAPCSRGIDAAPFERDELMAVFPKGHDLAKADAVPLTAFLDEPFLALEHGADTEVAALFAEAGIAPHMSLHTWDDYAIMAMVEGGLGLAILPSLILNRVPYEVETRPLDPPAYRKLVFATKSGARPSAALTRFREHLLKHAVAANSRA